MTTPLSPPVPSDVFLFIARRATQAGNGLTARALEDLDHIELVRVALGFLALLQTGFTDGTTPIVPTSDSGFTADMLAVRKNVGVLSPIAQPGDT